MSNLSDEKGKDTRSKEASAKAGKAQMLGWESLIYIIIDNMDICMVE